MSFLVKKKQKRNKSLLINFQKAVIKLQPFLLRIFIRQKSFILPKNNAKNVL
jgi:hypothetical protein